MKKNKHLVIVSRISGVIDERGVIIQNLDGYFVDRLSQLFDRSSLILPLYHSDSEKYSIFMHYSYKITNKKLSLISIPDDGNHSVLKRSIVLMRQLRMIFLSINAADIVFIMMPTFRASLSVIISKLFRKYIVVYTGSNWPESARIMYRWNGLFGRLIKPMYIFITQFIQYVSLKLSDVRVINDETIYDKVKKFKGISIRSKPMFLLSKSDIYYRSLFSHESVVNILTIGSIQENKGVLMAIRAIHALHNKGINVRYDYVGAIADQKYYNDILEYIKNNSLENIVKYHGYLPNGDELYNLYKKSDIFLLPSLSEGFPRVLYESMAFGLNIVVSNLEKIMNRLDSGQCEYIEPLDYQSIVAGIERLIHDKSYSKDMLEKNYRFIENILEFDIIKQISMLL